MQSDNDWADSENLDEKDWINSINQKETENEMRFNTEKETATRNIWFSFQDSASAIAQLYKDRQYANSEAAGALWLPFQTAAGTVTKLFKESSDGMKRTNDSALQYGYQRRTKELADWAKNKRRRYIRREDLLSYLAGKPPPPPSSHSPGHYHNNNNNNNNNNFNNSNHHYTNHHNVNSRNTQLRSSPKPTESHSHIVQFGAPNFVSPNQGGVAMGVSGSDPADLHTFKEALALRTRAPDLYAFVAAEIARNCNKRPASPLDVNMESHNKRQRYQ